MDPVIFIDSYHAANTNKTPSIITSKPLPALLAPPLPMHDPASNGGSLSSFFSSTSTLSLYEQRQQEDHAYIHHPPSSTAYYTVIQKQSQEIQDLKQDLKMLNQKYINQFDRIQIAEQAQYQVESELEDLSRKLFEQANEMVAQERKARFIAEKKCAQLERELKCIYEELGNERDQLNELRAKFESSSQQQQQQLHPLVISTTESIEDSRSTRSSSISSSDSNDSRLTSATTALVATDSIHLDDGWLALFQDFLSLAHTTPLESLHKLPFLKQCLDLDIEPCLRFGVKSRLSIKRVLDAIMRQPCFIESSSSSSSDTLIKRHSHDDRSGTLLNIPPIEQHQPVARRSSFAFMNKLKASPSPSSLTAEEEAEHSCYGCGNLIKDKLFKFKLKEIDTEWYWIDRSCRDRLVAVCDFYVFIRHVRDGVIQQSKSVTSLFQECVWLRLVMFWARSGVHHHPHR